MELNSNMAADNAKGRFFLTGSQSYDLVSSASESLAGRISIVEMSGLSARELFHVDFKGDPCRNFWMLIAIGNGSTGIMCALISNGMSAG